MIAEALLYRGAEIALVQGAKPIQFLLWTAGVQLEIFEGRGLIHRKGHTKIFKENIALDNFVQI